MRSVAIVGAWKAGEPAPYSDPDWEIWTVGRLAGHLPRIDRIYELHGPEHFAHVRESIERTGAEVVRSDDLPLEQWGALYGNLKNSIAIMLCDAMHEGVDRVAMFNAPHRGEPTNEQRESVAYWIGYLRGRGVVVEDRSEFIEDWEKVYGGKN